jgi:hypothetical protein
MVEVAKIRKKVKSKDLKVKNLLPPLQIMNYAL